MIRISLAELHVHRVNTEIPRMLERVKIMTRHVNLLSDIGKSKVLEARDLLRCVNEARGEAMQLRHGLIHLAELKSGVRRSHLGNAYGAFASGFEGSVKRVGVEFDKMESAIRRLQAVASERLAEPGRWGDASASNPVNDLLGLLFQLLEVWGLLRVRKKLEG